MSYPKYRAAGIVVGDDWDALTRTVLSYGGATAIVGFNANLTGRENYFLCDGTADEVQINLAISYVNGLGGGTVILERGTFTTTSEIDMYDNVDFRGQGMWGSIIFLAAASNCSVIRNEDRVNGNTQMAIRDLQIDGNKANQTLAPGGRYQNTGINFYFCSYTIVEGCYIHDCVSDGYLAFTDSLTAPSIWSEYHWVLNNLVVDNGSNALALVWGDGIQHWARYVVVSGNYCEGNDDTDISNNTGSHFTVSGNICRGATGNAITVAYGASQVAITGNVISSGATGINLWDDDTDKIDVVITGNYISAATNGIVGYRGFDKVKIEGNIILGDSAGVFLIETIEHLSISGNIFRVPNEYAVVLRGAVNSSVDNNLIFESKGGIYLLDDAAANPCDHIKINSNHIIDSTDNGILVVDNTTDCELKDNILDTCGIYGIDIQDSTVLQTRVFGNVFYNCITDFIRDNGTDTRLPTIQAPFSVYLNGATMNDSGMYVTAIGNRVVAYPFLPLSQHQIVRVVIWARAITGTANQMRLEIKVRAGAENEPYLQINAAYTDVPSDTSNFAGNDVIKWVVEDATMRQILGGDQLEIEVLFEAAGNGDIETDAVFKNAVLQYV